MMQTEALLLAAEGEASNPLLPAIYDIVWSIIPFALVLLLFWRVVLPRLQKTLDERSEAIEGGIAQAESAQAEAKEALEKYNALLADARAEAASLHIDHAEIRVKSRKGIIRNLRCGFRNRRDQA